MVTPSFFSFHFIRSGRFLPTVFLRYDMQKSAISSSHFALRTISWSVCSLSLVSLSMTSNVIIIVLMAARIAEY